MYTLDLDNNNQSLSHIQTHFLLSFHLRLTQHKHIQLSLKILPPKYLPFIFTCTAAMHTQYPNFDNSGGLETQDPILPHNHFSVWSILPCSLREFLHKGFSQVPTPQLLH